MTTHTPATDDHNVDAAAVTPPNRSKSQKRAKAAKTTKAKPSQASNSKGGFEVPVGETGEVVSSFWRFGE